MGLTSEDDILALIDAHFPRQGRDVVLGRGDDAAIVRCGPDFCVSTDIFAEDAHFRRRYFTPEDVGHKALAVNLSDLAGMGAEPLGFTLGLSLPADVGALWPDRLSRMFTGMAALAMAWGCPLLGGDLSRSDRLSLCLTVWGRSTRYLRRKSAQVGDVLFVVGPDPDPRHLPLGLARTGLHRLEVAPDAQAVADVIAAYPVSTAAHLRPAVLLNQARRCSESPAVRGLMDISDGLVRDLPRFLDKTQSADISLNISVIHPEIVTCAADENIDPAEFVLLGGEDYSLLGCADPDGFAEFRRSCPEAVVIGRVRSGIGILLNGRPFVRAGFDHFSS